MLGPTKQTTRSALARLNATAAAGEHKETQKQPAWLALATLCSFSKCLLLQSVLLIPYWSVFIVVTVPSWCQPVVSIKLNPRFLHHWHSTPNCTFHVVQFWCNTNNSSMIHVVQIQVENQLSSRFFSDLSLFYVHTWFLVCPKRKCLKESQHTPTCAPHTQTLDAPPTMVWTMYRHWYVCIDTYEYACTMWTMYRHSRLKMARADPLKIFWTKRDVCCALHSAQCAVL